MARICFFTLAGCRVAEPCPPLESWMTEREEEIRNRWGGLTPGSIPGMKAARDLYRATGIEPTRTRPSSEALVRRILKGGGLPRINPAVDLCNLSAVTYFLSIGLYDLGKIHPPIELGLGREGEHYQGLGKPRVNLESRLCSRDREGPFGNPTSDSLRTSVDEGSDSLLWLIYAPAYFDEETLAAHARWSADRALAAGICRETSAPEIRPAS